MITPEKLKERCKHNCERDKHKKVEVYNGDLLIMSFEVEDGFRKMDFINFLYCDANFNRFEPIIKMVDGEV